ncbi:MAG: Site-specific recombinase, phage integrase family/ribosomal subunit interface protein [uncultured bacterium (gcode 4)]|uniref:Site-specific recombinase, phage integrase family/ribosomal subunit interface protein n=1 Tax=uncultured bacterium (gcode 4) TaxID=1234023 RepID=K2F635_9BACT|nr:MAG: Site-specific recombinase, phage integrase family/ribosomal subunit interface protein [uncultured bacterium (gcode 4)]
MQEMATLIKQYLVYLEFVQNYTKVTVSWIKSSLNYFMNDNKIWYIYEINRNLVEEWLLNWRVYKKWKPSTYVYHHKHLNWFYKWLEKKGIVEENFIKDIEKPKLENTLPKWLKKEEAELILMSIKRLKYTYKYETTRNYTVIATMLLTWLRRFEILNLHINDIQLNEMYINVVQGKWRKDRIVPISTRLSVIFHDYIKERERLNKKCEHFFTTSQYDKPMGVRCIDVLVKKLRQKTKIDFSSHSLRHTFATLMLEWGCDIYTLSKMMWHSKITTTTIYLACSPKQMLKSIEKHPLN